MVAASVVNINEVPEGHVALEVECVERLYLNAYVPNLQVGGQVVRFLTGHRGHPIPSPALFAQIGNRFRREVRAFARERAIPVLALKGPDRTRWDDRKLDHVRPYLERAARAGRFGVVAIVQAQEFQWVFSGRDASEIPGAVRCACHKSERRVGVYYLYVLDPQWGPGFIKLCTYFPYPGKVWLNGHEWAKRQAAREGTTGILRTRIFGPGTEVKMELRYKRSRVKQYLEDGRALRIEAVINAPADLGVQARLRNLPALVAKARQVNRRLLMIERAGQGCAIGSALFERIHQPYAREGHRTAALRFGDQRAMALAGALCLMLHAVSGFTNKSLRGLVAGLLGAPYSAAQMSYDLRRLRLHGLITRIPRTNRYATTPEGIRVAAFYTKVHQRILEPLFAADHPPASLQLRRALGTIDRAAADLVTAARLGVAA